MMIISFVFVALCGHNDAVAAVTPTKMDKIFLRLVLSESAYIDANQFNATDLVSSMDLNKNTVIYIHGFTEHVNSSSVTTIVRAYLKRGDHNIIAVDWSELAGENYMAVVSHVEEVGVHIAQAINGMLKGGISPLRIHVVGHSMGAHVAGAVGRKVGFSLPRITGLDPAGPFFNFFNQRITHRDAQFVDIIHTDSGFYGIAWPTGSVDFWPNGGNRVQPGCPQNSQVYSNEDFCSHHRSYIYYAESLINENAFLSVKCTLEPALSRKSLMPIPMGYATPINTHGSYCLITETSEPFGLGAEGAQTFDSIIQLLPI